MLVQPQQAATVCELDPVQHTIGSSKRAQTLDPNQPPESSYDPLNLTLDLEHAHVSGHSLPTSVDDSEPTVAPPARTRQYPFERGINQFADRPDMIGNADLHCGRGAQCFMNLKEV